MLILLPPSEGKTAPETGDPVDLGSLAFPSLNKTRERLLDVWMLSPLATMKRGAVIEWANVYTLVPRSRGSPEDEAQAMYQP